MESSVAMDTRRSDHSGSNRALAAGMRAGTTQRTHPGAGVPGTRTTSRRTSAAVGAMWLVSLLSVAASLVVSALAGPSDLVGAIGLGAPALSFATAGAILESRLPANPIGGQLLLGGLSFALGSAATGLGTYGLVLHRGAVPGAIWFAWLSEWIWAPAIGSVIALALIYPTGRLLSPRWRPVAAALVLVIASLAYGGAFGAWTDGTVPDPNPLLVTGGVAYTIASVASVIIGPVAIAVAILAVASLVLRYRRAAGVERAQLKWFAAVGAASVPLFLIGTALYGASGLGAVVANVASTGAYVGFTLLPVAIGIAVTRYRLFEIDRLISRGISYGLLTVILAGTFVGVVLVSQSLLAPVTGSNELAVAASTLIVFAAFQPLRNRLQQVVDRRFNRAKVDADRTVAAFAGRLRDEVDLDALAAEVSTTIGRAVEPSSIAIWLRG